VDFDVSIQLTLCIFQRHRGEEHSRRAHTHTVHDTYALQVTICRHNTDDALYSLYVSTFNRVCNF